jgi:hypothetical protein
VTWTATDDCFHDASDSHIIPSTSAKLPVGGVRPTGLVTLPPGKVSTEVVMLVMVEVNLKSYCVTHRTTTERLIHCLYYRSATINEKQDLRDVSHGWRNM